MQSTQLPLRDPLSEAPSEPPTAGAPSWSDERAELGPSWTDGRGEEDFDGATDGGHEPSLLSTCSMAQSRRNRVAIAQQSHSSRTAIARQSHSSRTAVVPSRGRCRGAVV